MSTGVLNAERPPFLTHLQEFETGHTHQAKTIPIRSGEQGVAAMRCSLPPLPFLLIRVANDH